MKLGERWLSLARMFNVMAGFTSKEDTLPSRFFIPLKKGPYMNKKVTKRKFKSAIMYYYGMMGWDKNGIPMKEKLAELGIEWVKSL